MTDHRSSYGKTTAVGMLGLAVAMALVALLGWAAFHADTVWAIRLLALAVAALTAVGAGWLGLAVAGGFIALHRDALEAAGRPYVRYGRAEATSGFVPAATSWVRRARSWARRDPTPSFRPGELAQVRSLQEILRTLDEHGTRDGLPFMPEMTAFCGQRFRVLRRVEKLNDWVHKRGLRRMRHIVLLDQLRCDGSAHGGCCAHCHLRWHETWLERPRRAAAPPSPPTPAIPAALPVLRTEAGGQRFFCQATELTAGSTPLRPGDPRLYLREWLVGNVRLPPLLGGASLAAFRWLQTRRGGAAYPLIVPGAGKGAVPGEATLRAGDLVRVRSKREIERTLNDQLRNRGLYFDGELLRHCGATYRVRSRVERLVLEKTGRLVTLKNPTVILEGVTATGELVAFNPENEHIFWRECWLEPIGSAAAVEQSPPEKGSCGAERDPVRLEVSCPRAVE